MENEKKINKSVYLIPSIWERLKKAAELEDRSVNQIIKIAILEYLKKRGV